MFCSICTWINGWVNNREAGDLRCYCAHYDVTVMMMPYSFTLPQSVSILRPKQNGCYFPDNIFRCILLPENVWIFIKISLYFLPVVSVNNFPALVQIMAWHRPGDRLLSEPLMVRLAMIMHHSASTSYYRFGNAISNNNTYLIYRSFLWDVINHKCHWK